MNQSEKPTYKHDCSVCTFLGRYKDEYGDYDLYYCSTEPTIVSRYGNKGPEYYSGTIQFSRHSEIDQPLSEGYKRAIIHGFISSNGEIIRET